MLNQSLLNLGLYIQPLETCLAISCPSFSSPPSWRLLLSDYIKHKIIIVTVGLLN